MWEFGSLGARLQASGRGEEEGAISLGSYAPRSLIIGGDDKKGLKGPTMTGRSLGTMHP